MQWFGIAQNAEPKASKSFRACDAGGARFGDLSVRPVGLNWFPVNDPLSSHSRKVQTEAPR